MSKISKGKSTTEEIGATCSKSNYKIAEMNQDKHKNKVDKQTGTNPKPEDVPSLNVNKTNHNSEKNLGSNKGSLMSLASGKAMARTLHAKKVAEMQHELRKLEGEVNLKIVELKMKRTRVSRLEAQLATDHPDYAEENVANLETEIRKMKADIEDTIQALEILTIENTIEIGKLKGELEVETKEYEEYMIGLEEQNSIIDLENESIGNVTDMDETVNPPPLLAPFDDDLGSRRTGTPVQEGSDVMAVMDKIGDALNLLAVNSSRMGVSDRFVSRQTLGKDLPLFGGKPETWPAFHSAYKNTTTACGFSEQENVERLRKCLRGEAYQTVQGLFSSPYALSSIMSLLEEKYGQPKLVVRSLLKSVRDCPPVRENQPATLIKFGEAVRNTVATMKNMQQQEYLQGSVLVDEFSERLPNSIRRGWDRALLESTVQDNLEDFTKWLEAETRIAYRQCPPKSEAVGNKNDAVKHKTHAEESKDRNREDSTAAALLGGQVIKKECLFCKKDSHPSSECPEAETMKWDEKSKILKSRGACFTCFKFKHMARYCKAKTSCPLCNKRHLRPMCPTLPANKREDVGTLGDKCEDKTKDASASDLSTNLASFTCRKDIKLMTVVVQIKGTHRSTTARLLFDNGCQTSQGAEDLIKMVGGRVIGESIQNYVQLSGPVDSRLQKHYEVVIKNLDGSYQKKIVVAARTEVCPAHIPRINIGSWISELKKKDIFLSDLQDEREIEEPEVEILIGSDYFGDLLSGEIIPLKCGLNAIKTKLGWTLNGRENTASSGLAGFTVSSFCLFGREQDLWNLEAIGIKDPIEQMNKRENEIAVMKHFQDTVSQEDSGRYVVSLPWSSAKEYLPDNFDIAKARLRSMTQKLLKANKFQDYHRVFENWIEEGLIEEVEERTPMTHYLPHRAVFKPESLTTPIRPVFDASCKSGGNPSLNDCLEKGPNLLEQIPTILLRFRENKIGIISDIRKAFQMIFVKMEDRDYLRFLWWTDEKREQLRIFRHCRVVFGVNCSPFLLAAVINLHLQKVKDDVSISQKLLRSFYVDNCVTSVNSEKEYQQFRNAATNFMGKAMMELRQWESSADVHHDTAETSVLGLSWDKKNDQLFCMVPKLSPNPKMTKREILSVLQQVYDPLGFLCPAILIPKLLMQKAWVMKLSWDMEIPAELKDEFQGWLHELPDLGKIKIARQVKEPMAENLEIHTFSDASLKGYSAVVFLRSEVNGTVMVSLLQAKARIAPLKPATIPRLELLGCLIGVRLTNQVKEALDMQDTRTHFWTDSSTVLAWIRRDSHWGTFVKNRVDEIRSNSKMEEWFHVPGERNPADLPSRGCSPGQLLRSKWWEGPEWLCLKKTQWPHSIEEPDEIQVQKEIKKIAVSTLLMTPSSTDEIWYNFKFSSYRKNVRVLGFIVRFINKSRKRSSQKGELTTFELHGAEQKLFALIQSDNFDKNEKVIGGIKVCERNGLICVVTKLLYRQDSECFKMPVLLPHQHPLIEKLVREEHIDHCHAGVQNLMSIIREKCWILQGRQTIRSVVRSCLKCKRFTSKPLAVETAALPNNRVKDCSVFEVTGIDLAGPLYLKCGSKSWFVIFTCAVYRCLHLELVESLSTEAFMLALIRFIKRRGRPEVIYTDNGSNFLGTAGNFEKIQWDKIQQDGRLCKITWIFNPPAAPWWGGFWERLVRSIKDLLKRMLGHRKLTYVQLETILCEIEGTLNSRPLTLITEDSEDLIPLTPAMFLHELPSVEFPEAELIEDKKLRMKFKAFNKLRKELKERFRKEYLALLVQRGKDKKTMVLKVGDLVLLGSDNVKRQLWPMGRVIELMPGRDGKIRVAKVKTNLGVKVRAVQKLYLLEISSETEVPGVVSKSKEQLVTDSDIKNDKVVRKYAKKNPVVDSNIQQDVVVRTRSQRQVKKPVRYGYL